LYIHNNGDLNEETIALRGHSKQAQTETSRALRYIR